MTSKTSSQILTDALTSRQWIDPLQSTVDVNVTDGLFAIAAAINRLAAVEELKEERINELDRHVKESIDAAIAADDPAAGNA
jgi:hypothetical protein